MSIEYWLDRQSGSSQWTKRRTIIVIFFKWRLECTRSTVELYDGRCTPEGYG